MAGIESIFLVILSLLSLPLQIIEYVIWNSLDLLAFDVFQLGSYLPITF